jgi:hypothetical protein
MKTVITLQALRFKLKCLNQTCISLKSNMQFTRTFFFYSATFIEKKRVENRLWPKSEFLWPKKIHHLVDRSGREPRWAATVKLPFSLPLTRPLGGGAGPGCVEPYSPSDSDAAARAPGGFQTQAPASAGPTHRVITDHGHGRGFRSCSRGLMPV